MNTIKIFSLLGFASLSMIININCDDRVPDAAASSNATLEITALQAIADTENQESVGYILSIRQRASLKRVVIWILMRVMSTLP